ncbi:class GN sortase [Marinobacterium mangrovicola]|uniref:Sortase A n=1 Tax=Marinobacterium mangrovicola TaxID=1476959 RepID=A0A4R1GH23_9GAMM|nr:class GN sortase [Marinobacterium mangrovicola]TCK07398.1 sortase A [Marinobacterium mangrovicola]
MSLSRTAAQRLMILALLLGGAAMIVQALWIPFKAEIAQALLQRAWTQTQADGEPHPPWPWADHYPVARLSAERFDIDQIVLAGDEGSSLAFAPGENMQAKNLSGAARVISGHRDTHFRFLQAVLPGDRFQLSDSDGRVEYRVDRVEVVDSTRVRLDPTALPNGLLLVTCYPFDALTAGGPLRYVVSASRVTP